MFVSSKKVKENFKSYFHSFFCVKRMVSFVWDVDKKYIIFSFILYLVQGIIPTLNIIVGKQILDMIVSNKPRLNYVVFLLSFQLLVLVSHKCLTTFQGVYVNLTREKLTYKINRYIATKVTELDISYFDLPTFHNMFSNAKSETGSRVFDIMNLTMGMWGKAITLLTMSLVLIKFSPFIYVLIVIFTLPTIFTDKNIRKKTYLFRKDYTKDSRRMNYFQGLLTSTERAKEIRLYQMEKWLLDKYDNEFSNLYKKFKNMFIWRGSISGITSVVVSISNAAIYFYLVICAIRKIISIGNFSMYTSFSNQVSSLFLQIASDIISLYENSLYADNLFSFLDLKTKMQSGKLILNEKKNGHSIDFVNVSFSYPGQKHYILKSVNFTIHEGESVALIGLNGAGKSTLIKLLSRLYDPNEGQILIDGIDIKNYDIDSLRSIYSILFQDYGRYSLTIRENIYLDKSMDEELHHLKAIINICGIDALVNDLPFKYETQLTRSFDKDGIELSGGQWQKVALARSIVRESGILILDEPTNSLDAKTEQSFFKVYKHITSRRTNILITHNLSNTALMDKIIHINEGQIIEVGSHDELYKKGGEYANIYKTYIEKNNISDKNDYLIKTG